MQFPFIGRRFIPNALPRLPRHLTMPYEVDGAARFNLLFSHLYPQLSPAERHCAKAFADAVMANLERRAVPKHVADVY